MPTKLDLLLWQSLFAAVTFARGALARCPHEDPSLLRWSIASNWPGGKKPEYDTHVDITNAVLLDESPPELHSITIKGMGRLVWSPGGDYSLRLKYLFVQGRLDIGSEECPHPRNARITLTGIRGEYSIPEFGEKFVGVTAGATLELHGAKKLSWTKLTATLPKLTSTNGLAFQHSTSEFKNFNTWKAGLYVYVIDENNGQVLEHDSFYTAGDDQWWTETDSPKLVAFLDSIQDGRFVMLAVQIGLVGATSGGQIWEVYDAVERLGYDGVTGTGLIRQVGTKDAYVMITQKGTPAVTQELRKPPGTDFSQTVILSYTDWGWGLTLVVISSVNIDVNLCFVDFKVLHTDGAYPVLDLLDDVTSWAKGDRILVTSTDFDWKQAEVGTVIPCPSCNANQIRLDLATRYMHWGEVVDGVDERAEVALLTRNIVIEGTIQATCPPSNGNCEKFDYDTFGGHLRVAKGFKDVHMEGVEFYHMGQQTEVGNYPIHFHMAEDVDVLGGYSRPTYIRDLSIHASFARCITVHGTHGLIVKNNVGYGILGHCYFLEDGGEKRTLIEGNLGASITAGELIPSDSRALSIFWITNPQTVLRNNVAAGSDGTGFWFIYPDEPMGQSAGRGYMSTGEAKHTRITEFTNNVAHSNKKVGLFIDHQLTQDGFIRNNNGYNPRVNPLDKHSDQAKVDICRFTAYKNRDQNAWIRGGWVVVNQSSFADSAVGLTLARGSQGEQFLENSIIVGETKNIGEPSKFYNKATEEFVYLPRAYPIEYRFQTPIQGFSFYDGPVHISDVWFNGFMTNENRTASAIGFHRNNLYPSSPVSSAKRIYFGFSDGIRTGNRVYDGNATVPGFTDKDGNKEATFRDVDGSVTGVVGSQVVKPGPFYTTAGCYRRENWNLAICPHRYGKIALGKLPKEDVKTQPLMVRDDIPEVYEIMSGDYAADFNVILGGSHSYTLHWSHHVPTTITIRGWGIEKNYPIRFGVCMPRDAKFDLYSYSPNWLPTINYWGETQSVEQLDKDISGKKYFWDQNLGMLFLKFQVYQSRRANTTTNCPGDKCPMVKVTLLSGNSKDCDCRKRVYGPYRRKADVSQHTLVNTALPSPKSRPPETFGAVPRKKPGYSEWSNWAPCSKTCGGGAQIRERTCTEGMHEKCTAAVREETDCGAKYCAVNGGFSDWSVWTVCFKLNGCQGFQRRTRECNSPRPHSGGLYCQGSTEAVRSCPTC